MTMIDTSPPKRPDDYHFLLKQRGIKPRIKWLQDFVNIVAKQNITLAAVSLVFLSFGISFTAPLWCNILSGQCRYTINELTNILELHETKKAEPDSEKHINRTENKTRTENRNEAYFDGAIFRNSIIFFAFILAFMRWQVAIRQEAMSEIFLRKQASNLQILANKDATKPLVAGAINLKTNRYDQPPVCLDATLWEEVLSDFKNRNPHGDLEPSFEQSMFVYMELDNLEFAYMKYVASYLDDEQMYRACEIFESRCQSTLFRYMAAKQGLAYYTDELHFVIKHLLVFGFAQSSCNTGQYKDHCGNA
jgi:hypothetical protein